LSVVSFQSLVKTKSGVFEESRRALSMRVKQGKNKVNKPHGSALPTTDSFEKPNSTGRATRLKSLADPWVSTLGAFCPSARSSRPLALVQSLANQCLDDGLPANVEIPGGALEFFQHGGAKIHVHALDRFSHLAGVGEKARNILSPVRHPGDGFG
jgi:hypothetical protein